MNNRNNHRGPKNAPTVMSPALLAQRKPGLAQPKTLAAHLRQPAKPAPVGHGHGKPASQVLQGKMAVNARAQSLGNRKPPVAPPVYRPQSPPRVLQPKVAQPGLKPPHMTNNVVQRVLILKDQKEPVKKITDVDEAMLIVNYQATPRAITRLKQQAISKDPHEYDDWAAAVKAANAWTDPLERLKRTNQRNRNKKAMPRGKRFIYDLQKKHSYGYTNKVIDSGILKGSYRSSRGQPFLSLNKDNYGGVVLESDYDSIIAVFKNDKKHTEPDIAETILVLIDDGKFDQKEYSPKMRRAISTIVQLTQLIEPHVNRIAGADKWARACFTRIVNAESNFWSEFNRTSGNYLPARAKTTKKKKLSKYGGQESSRTLMSLPKKKTDRSRISEVKSPEVIATLDEMSESSDDDMQGT